MTDWSELKTLCLARPPVTLAVAESLTCGQVQARIGRISGASHFFLGGITAYSLEQKVQHLGVTRTEAVASECVSDHVVREMARGACRLFGSDLAVATTGYAEQPPVDRGDAPFAWWAVAQRRGRDWNERAGRIVCQGLSREAVQAAVADAVLTELCDFLRQLRG